MPNQVGLKLEAAIKSYIAANYQGSGEELNGVTLCLGKTPEVLSATSYVAIEAGQEGGPHAREGNYEIPVTFEVVTSMEKFAGTETESSLRLAHGQKVEAIAGIFSESRVGTVKAALMVLDAELGVSSFWHESVVEGFEDNLLVTRVVKVFEAYLV